MTDLRTSLKQTELLMHGNDSSVLRIIAIGLCAVVTAACDDKTAAGPSTRPTASTHATLTPSAPSPTQSPSPVTVAPASPTTHRSDIVNAARTQIGRTVTYDGAYAKLAYPGGDVPLEKGVCTDVVVRALRDARQFDLQKLVHEDMQPAFSSYPQNWGLRKPDRNIDHRRVPNLATYFTRQRYAVPVTRNPADYRPGDLVTCTIPPALPHIMIVSDRRSAEGLPLVIHNIGRGTQEEDRLFDFPITGHFRLPDAE